MGALNKEYIYKMLEEDSEFKTQENLQAARNSIYIKNMLNPSRRFMTRLMGPQFGGFLGAAGAMYGPLYAKTKITGDQQLAAKIAQDMPFEFLQDPHLIQALGITPYTMSQMAGVQSNIANTRKIDNKFISDDDFAKYGRMASMVHGYSNFRKIVPGIAAAAAGGAALSGAGGLASMFAHLNPLSMTSSAGSLLTGGLHALTGLSVNPLFATIPLMFGLTKLTESLTNIGKKSNTRRIPVSNTVPGATLLYSQSTYNQHVGQITLLQSQGLLTPKDALMLTILNDINLNTTPLRVEFAQKQVGEKQFQNDIVRNRLLDIFDPQEEDLGSKSWLLTDDTKDSISSKELQKRKASYHLNTTFSLLHSLGMTALAGPLATLFTGKNYNETRKDVFDILYGNDRLRAQAHDEAAKRLKLPGDLFTAIHTPVTKWLNYETPEAQRLAILANMHEMLRSASLSLVGINKILGGDKPGNDNIYTLLEDLENDYLMRGKEPEDLDFIDSLLGPIWGSAIKGVGKTAKFGAKGLGFLLRGLAAPGELAARFALDAFKPREGKNRVDSYFDSIGSGLSNLITAPGEKISSTYKKTKKFLFSDVKDIFGNSFIGDALRRRLGYVSKEDINDEFDKALKEEKSYDKRESAYAFLSDYFPDMTTQILEELKQQTVYLANMLDCWDCKKTTIKRSNKKWRGSEGEFLSEKDFANRINSRALDKLKTKLGYTGLKNMTFGKVSKFFYKKFFGIKEDEFHDLANHMDNIVGQRGMTPGDMTFTPGSPSNERGFGILRSLYSRFSGRVSGANGPANVSDETLQENIVNKKIQTGFIIRDKQKAKNILNIKKNTDFNPKIFKLLKNYFKNQSEFQKKLLESTNSSNESLLNFLAGIAGAWGLKKLRDKILKKRNKNRPHEEKHKNNKNNKNKPHEEEKHKNNKNKAPHEENYKNNKNKPHEENYKRNKGKFKYRSSTVHYKPEERPIRSNVRPRGKLKVLLNIIIDKFTKRGLGKAIRELIERALTRTALASIVAPETFGFSYIMDIFLTLWDFTSFIIEYWDVFLVAWAAFEVYISHLKQEKQFKQIVDRNHHYLRGTASKKEFDSLLNSNKDIRKEFRGVKYYLGRKTYKDDLEFKNKYLKNYVNEFTTPALERIYKYGKKYKEFKSEDDEIKYYQMLQFKKFIDSHKLNDKFKHMTNKDLGQAFDEFVHHKSQFVQDYVGVMETNTQINVKAIEQLKENFVMLKQIARAAVESANYLKIMTTKMEVMGTKTVTAVAK